ncbi:hypothetical protein PsorP6_012312 [Peronosclerospora sorghi]|uniref:Uncharacterized protein n=1 Tax=Peronosclerospora sorghi TaxID=230839 RepID=A0ACC0WGK4_9STRA|nr:hypothetical protein PsorP6_012312 [Peronosclerospora sorghi]
MLTSLETDSHVFCKEMQTAVVKGTFLLDPICAPGMLEPKDRSTYYSVEYSMSVAERLGYNCKKPNKQLNEYVEVKNL